MWRGAGVTALVSKKLQCGGKEQKLPPVRVESTNLFQHIDAHAVLRTSLAYMSLCFLLCYYFKNGLLK